MSYTFDAACDDAPAQRCARLARARRLFAAFAGCPASSIAARRIDRRIPDVLVDLGALRGVVYTRDHGGVSRTYIHFMDDPPRLACDAHGRQLYVLGGSYRITRRGIEG
jgi:hypothetical protein